MYDESNELAELGPLFVAEAEQYLAELEEMLVALDDDPSSAHDFSGVARAMHTIKGSASLLGFDAISKVGHGGEDVLTALKAGEAAVTDEVVSLLLEAVDAISAMVRQVAEGAQPDGAPYDDLVSRLSAWASEDRVGEPVPDDTPSADSPSDDTISEEAPSADSPSHDSPSHDSPSNDTTSNDTTPDNTTSRDTADVATRGAKQRTMRVDIAKLDRLVDLANEVALERRSIASRIDWLGGDKAQALGQAFEEGERSIRELHDTVIALRLVPLGPTLRRFGRAVRDIAVSTGKEAQLVIEGEAVEVDTSMAEALVEPLTHLVRNAVDHGLETPAERVAAGKPETGTVTLRARPEGGAIVIEVHDDGSGLSRAKLVDRARSWNIPEPEQLDDAELHALVFQPGFSTAERLSDLSGRGVGMDIVRRMVEGLRGSVTLHSREGQETTVVLRVPLSASTVNGLQVRVGEGTYIVPIDNVVECLDPPLGTTEDQGLVDLRGTTLPYVRLRRMFAVEGPAPHREHMLIVRHGPLRAGLLVDRLLGHVESMTRPLDHRLSSRLSGSALLEDGGVGLIVDLPVLLQDLTSGPASRGPTYADPDLN